MINYRVANLDDRQRTMLDFTAVLTESSHRIEESDRDSLRQVGFNDEISGT